MPHTEIRSMSHSWVGEKKRWKIHFIGYPACHHHNEEAGMTQERLSLRKIREVLRLKHEVGLSNRAIARACRVSNSTVGEYVRRAEQAGLAGHCRRDLGEEELYRKLFPEGEAAKDSQNVRSRTGKGASGIGTPRGDLDAAVAGISGEVSGWIWIDPVPGVLPALEPNPTPACASRTRVARRWKWIMPG